MRTLFITGGCGFIGVNFVHYWRKHHPEDFIINYDLLTYAGCRESQKGFEADKNYRFVQGDILDALLLSKIFSGTFEDVPKPDLIIHFAAETHVDRSIEDPETFIRSNVLGTQVLLEAARKHGNIRFHHISTDEVFGSLKGNDPPWIKNSPYQPRSPYSASKAASDHLVRAYAVTYGLPITISTCSNNYGPYQFPEKLIALAITNLLQEKKIPLYADGQNRRDWLFVEDHCEALEKILLHGQIGETYLIGGGRELTNLEVVKSIAVLMGKDESWIESVPDRQGHDFRYSMDISETLKALDWKPKTSFQEGLKKTVEWFQSKRHWWEAMARLYE